MGSYIDILRAPRIVAAGTITGLAFAASTGCGGPRVASEEENKIIEASYSKSFVNAADTACYKGEIDEGDTLLADLPEELDRRPWIKTKTLKGLHNAALNIDTILRMMHKLSGETPGEDGDFYIQPGDTYQFCVGEDPLHPKKRIIESGNPLNFTAVR